MLRFTLTFALVILFCGFQLVGAVPIPVNQDSVDTWSTQGDFTLVNDAGEAVDYEITGNITIGTGDYDLIINEGVVIHFTGNYNISFEDTMTIQCGELGQAVVRICPDSLLDEDDTLVFKGGFIFETSGNVFNNTELLQLSGATPELVAPGDTLYDYTIHFAIKLDAEGASVSLNDSRIDTCLFRSIWVAADDCVIELDNSDILNTQLKIKEGWESLQDGGFGIHIDASEDDTITLENGSAIDDNARAGVFLLSCNGGTMNLDDSSISGHCCPK